MVAMPTARPQHVSMNTTRPGTRPAHALASFRPGALWRMADGETFRVSKDATRIHFAATNNRRNVVHISSDAVTPSRLPDATLRALLTRFAASPAWAKAHRTWRTHQDESGRWSLALELRGGERGRVHFPPPAEIGDNVSPGIEVDVNDVVAVERVVALLWELADAFEQNPDAPADLSVLRQNSRVAVG